MERQHEPTEGIWTIDAQGNTMFANEAMAVMLRTTVVEMLGKPSFQFVYPEDLEYARRLFEGKRHGDMSPFEFRVRRKDGSPLWVTVQGTPMHDDQGKFRGIIGTFRANEQNTPLKLDPLSVDESV
jgi:PAS domain S-box-containing protein